MKKLLIAFGLFCFGAAASADSFIIPYDAEVSLTPAGGDAAGATEFGLGASQADAVPLFENLPATSATYGPAQIGFYAAGTRLNVYMETSWAAQTGYAFSDDDVTASSRTAFMDLDNSLGLGGSIYQEVNPQTYEMHLDDGLSYLIDDDDNDVLMLINLQPVPEPSSIMALGVIANCLLRKKKRRPFIFPSPRLP